MPSLSDLKRGWLLRSLGLSSSILTEQDLEIALYESSGVGSYQEFDSGRYYGPIKNQTVVNGAPALDVVRLVAFVVGNTASFDNISVNVITGGGVGSVIKLGIYGSLNGVPNELVVETSSVVSTGTGATGADISVTLTPGVYWLAYVPQGGTVPTISCFSAHHDPLVAHVAHPGPNNYSHFLINPVSGSLPLIATSGGFSVGGSTDSPRVLVRAA